MSAPSAAPHRLPRGWTWALAAVLLVVGLWARLRELDTSALFIDEGESCLNALSILEHGYPADHYLGLPMFENTLTEPWPEHPEYEFRDTSYSARGMAVYHGWLPLYAIALSFRLHGIEPDLPARTLAVRHDADEIRTRIRAARLPAVAFGLLFLVVLFLAGRELHGEAAGLVALALGAGSQKCIWIAQQARYYSAALALSTLCAWLIWRAARHGRMRDHAWAALALVLLFHTSSLAFASLCLAGLVLLPSFLRQPAWRRGFALAALLLGAGLLPWLAWTGYLAHSARIPMARAYLEPLDYLQYLRGVPLLASCGSLALLLFAGLWLRRAQLSGELATAVQRAGGPIGWLTAWTVAGFFGFQALVPVASCSLGRLGHHLLAGPILLLAIGIGLVVSLTAGRRAGALLGLALIGGVLAGGGLLAPQRRNPHESEAVWQVVEALRAHTFRADTRLYALPYQHFCLTFYTGLPVQSIAPVRRSFLAQYPGEILLLETANRVTPPPPEAVLRAAAAEGVVLDEIEAQRWSGPLMRAMVQAELAPLVAQVSGGAAPETPWLAGAACRLLAEESSWPRGRFDYSLDNPAMFRRPTVLALEEFWAHFFYAFVAPESRLGAGLNYAVRLSEAEARILPSSWVWLRIPPRATSAPTGA